MNILNILQRLLYGSNDPAVGRVNFQVSGRPDNPGTAFKPPVRSLGYSCEVDEPTPEPDGDGWIKLPNGDRYRKIKCGQGAETIEDEPQRCRGSLTKNNPFENYGRRD